MRLLERKPFCESLSNGFRKATVERPLVGEEQGWNAAIADRLKRSFASPSLIASDTVKYEK